MNKNSAPSTLSRAGIAWLAATSFALTLAACGGSDASTSPTAQNINASATPAASDQPASSATPATPDQPASAPQPTGFQVGTTSYDPALPPEPTLPFSAQICATLPAALTA
ncbi:endopolygalacturonase [Caballeronia catudaia]|uniref:Endopolygalacturonase n=1 Tax=Caballeronia catudaia TaxID=1777136 RepID=A0A158B340_9BURK|nr:hypothetical protein [Caballeronia catudaia]SAK64409.1 endopolygalacturonase [Caballeronia catudaia]